MKVDFVHNISLDAQTLKAKKEEIERSSDSFNETIKEMCETIKGYCKWYPLPLRYKASLCRNGIGCELWKEGRCNYSHSLHSMIAFNLCIQPTYKRYLCDRSPCRYFDTEKCLNVHPGDLQHIQVSRNRQVIRDYWKIYKQEVNEEPEANTSPTENEVLALSSEAPTAEDGAEEELIRTAVNAHFQPETNIDGNE